jgi:hypothetical protein
MQKKNFRSSFLFFNLLLFLQITCKANQSDSDDGKNLTFLLLAGDQSVRQRATQGPIPLLASCNRGSQCINEYFLTRLSRFGSSCGEIPREQKPCTSQNSVGVCRVRFQDGFFTDFTEYVYYTSRDPLESSRANCESIKSNSPLAKEVVFESSYTEKSSIQIVP